LRGNHDLGVTDTLPSVCASLTKAGVPKLGYICLSEGVHVRLAIEGKSMYIHYSFQIVYTYEFV